MSGAFKGVTLTAERNASENEVIEVRSMIKPWKDIMGRIFTTDKTEDHRNYTLLHLCILKNRIDDLDPVSFDLGKLVLIERGVTDSLYYWTRGKIYGRETQEMIEKAVQEELNIVSPGKIVKKILLVNKDKEFIKNVILREPHRSAVFPGGLDDYLRQQDDYISFTSRYNDISEVIEINSARDYIEGLGLKFIEKL